MPNQSGDDILKQLKVNFKVAFDLKVASPITSYYIKTYTLNQALNLLKAERAKGADTADLTKTVTEWFNQVDAEKRELGDLLQDKDGCRITYYEFAYKFFGRCDDRFRDDDWDEQLAQDFFYAGILFDSYDIFEQPEADMAKHKKYAKVCRLKIMKAIKTGTLPTPKSKQSGEMNDEKVDPNSDNPGIGNMNQFNANQSNFNQNQFGNQSNPKDPFSSLGGTSTNSVFVPQNQQDSQNQSQKGGGSIPNFAKFDMGGNAGNTSNATPGYGNISGGNNNYGGGGFGGQSGQNNTGTPGNTSTTNNNNNNYSNPYGNLGGLGNNSTTPSGGNAYGNTSNANNNTSSNPYQTGGNAYGNTSNTNANNNSSSPYQSGGYGQDTVKHAKPSSNKTRRPPEFYQQCEKAKDLCRRAVSELDYKRIKQAKQNLEEALDMLRQMDE